MTELHHDDKGCIAEAAFQYECLKRSITLFAPVKPTSRLDFIALRDDGSPVRIQVKWIWKKRDKKICDISLPDIAIRNQVFSLVKTFLAAPERSKSNH